MDDCRAAYRQAKKSGDHQSVIDVCMRIADAGDAEAQFYMGLFYMVGDFVPRDEKQAVTWFQKSAENGHVMGQFEMLRHSFSLDNPAPVVAYKSIVMGYGWQCVLSRQLQIPDAPGLALWAGSIPQSKLPAVRSYMQSVMKKYPISYGLPMKYMCWQMLKDSYPSQKSAKP